MPYAHTEKLDGFYIRIDYHTSGFLENPRTEYDNIGKMILFGRAKHLGDNHAYTEPAELVLELVKLQDPETGELFDVDTAYYWMREEQQKKGIPQPTRSEVMNAILDLMDEAPIYFLPVYKYEHGNIALNTTGFSCPWDSGQVGIIYMTHEEADKGFGPYLVEGETLEEKALAALKSEVATQHLYVSGTAYNVVIWKEVDGYEDGDYDNSDCQPIEEMIPYMGELENAIHEAREIVKDHAKTNEPV